VLSPKAGKKTFHDEGVLCELLVCALARATHALWYLTSLRCCGAALLRQAFQQAQSHEAHADTAVVADDLSLPCGNPVRQETYASALLERPLGIPFGADIDYRLSP
jgi:hypothetical protein